jgi:hypothetical protein
MGTPTHTTAVSSPIPLGAPLLHTRRDNTSSNARDVVTGN